MAIYKITMLVDEAAETTTLLDHVEIKPGQVVGMARQWGKTSLLTEFFNKQKEVNMKPFDLEAAKRGDTVCDKDGTTYKFIGMSDFHGIICERSVDFCIDGFQEHELFMKPKKRTVWVTFYVDGSTYRNDTEELAYRSFTQAEAWGRRRIGGKAYPVEVEE